MGGIERHSGFVRSEPVPLQGARVPCAGMSVVGSSGGRPSWVVSSADWWNGVVADCAEGLTRAHSGRGDSIGVADPGRRSRRELALGWYTAARWAARRALLGTIGQTESQISLWAAQRAALRTIEQMELQTGLGTDFDVPRGAVGQAPRRSTSARPSLKGWREPAQGQRSAALGKRSPRIKTRPERARVNGGTARRMNEGERNL